LGLGNRREIYQFGAEKLIGSIRQRKDAGLGMWHPGNTTPVYFGILF
jgi:hypothetical protein